MLVGCVELDTLGAFKVLLRNSPDASMRSFLLETTASPVGVLSGSNSSAGAGFASSADFDYLSFSSDITMPDIASLVIQL